MKIVTPIALLAIAACTVGDASDPTAATEYWAQPDTVVFGMGRPADIKALSRDRVWVADVMSRAIFSVSVPDRQYRAIGMADMEPVEVVLPAKLAIDPSLGLATYDAETGRIELLTMDGDPVRGFDLDFVPGVMSFSQEPVGLTFGVAVGEASARRALILRSDLQGLARDTLLSATHGPEALRDASAGAGEMFMAPSRSGMWVHGRVAPDTVFDVAPRGTRRLVLRSVDGGGQGILADRESEMLWIVLSSDSTGTVYSAYDTRLASVEPAPADSGRAYLGLRTTPINFRPWAIHDGIVIGTSATGRGSGLLVAYDLHTDRFARPETSDR